MEKWHLKNYVIPEFSFLKENIRNLI